ncbi:hypothetical protein [Clostridium perfringens]|uniref:Uncharacterized protein n=1 Tax=Clostridium perfringens TaxID=1502 RepID=A0A2X2Y0S1_CLOPF|nr:hypothetical protein [Clostridium perfringens]WEV20247.1 hypothetical protein PL323_06320 [Clostridium perfringens D]SQB58046.1 Uncharacterised protein [Clostridium perfringens]
MDTLIGMLTPFMIRLSFIMFVVAIVYLIWLMICSMKEKRNNDRYEMIEEDEEDDDTFQKAIIFIGNEKIEIDVDYCYIDDSTTRIESKDGKVYLTDIKNVVLISDKKEIF